MNRVLTRALRVLCALAIAPIIAQGAGRAAADTARDWQHVQEVLFGAHDSSTYDAAIVNRWTESPAIFVYGATAVDHAFADYLLVEFNPLLEPFAMRFARSDRSDASLAILLAPKRQIPGLALRHGMQAHLARLGTGYTEIIIRHDHSIDTSISLVVSSVDAAERHATMIHELYHALGPAGHSTVYRDSVVFADDEESSTAAVLSDVDIKLLVLLHRHLNPGDDLDAVRRAFDAHWDAIDPAAPGTWAGTWADQ